MALEVVLEELVNFVIYDISFPYITHLSIQVICNAFSVVKNNCLGLSQLDLNVLHKSKNFIILNKKYDVLINSNKPDVKVGRISFMISLETVI